MAGGRPTDYNDDISKKIIDRLAAGESVTKICGDDGYPNRYTVFEWNVKHPEFHHRYEKALKSSGQFQVDKIPLVIQEMKEGVVDPAVGKIEIDALKWMASKFYPKMYSDKQIVQSENKNTNLNMNTDVKLSDEDMAILERFGFKD